MSRTNTADDKRLLVTQAGPITSASWRAKVLLPPGRYRFEGSVQVTSVAALKFGKNHGGTLRVTGVRSERAPALLGDQRWQPLRVSFETTAREQEVELICDLRASRGTAYFDLASLRLVQER